MPAQHLYGGPNPPPEPARAGPRTR